MSKVCVESDSVKFRQKFETLFLLVILVVRQNKFFVVVTNRLDNLRIFKISFDKLIESSKVALRHEQRVRIRTNLSDGSEQQVRKSETSNRRVEVNCSGVERFRSTDLSHQPLTQIVEVLELNVAPNLR